MKKRAFILTLAAAGTALITFGQASKYSGAPGAKEFPSSDAVILSESIEYKMEPDGRVTENYFKAEKVLTYQGMDLIGDPKVAFNKDVQELKDYSLTTYTPDGRVVEAKANSFNEMTPYELEKAPAYTAWRQMVMTKVGLDLGAVVETRYVISDKMPWRHFFEGQVYFAGPFPCLKRTITISVPKGSVLNYAFENGQLKPETGDSGAFSTYTWKMEGAKQYDLWRSSLAEAAALPRLVFTTCKGWKEANDYVGRLVDSAVAQSSKELRKKAAEITTKSSTAFEKAGAIEDYVADDIPTVEWPISLAGFPQHGAADVFANGYGTPLDKAVLLCAMLKEAGVEAVPAACGLNLPSIEEVNDAPSLSRLNRIIVHATVDGKALWLDPCAKLSEKSQRDFQDFMGLPLTAGYGELHSMPPVGDKSSLGADLYVTLAKNFSYTGEGTFTFAGNYSTYYAAQGSDKALKAAAQRWLGSALPGAELTSSSVNTMSPDRVSVKVVFKGEAKKAGKGLHSIETGLPSGSLVAYTGRMSIEERDLPLLLPFSGHEEARLTLEIPEELKPAYVPKQIKENGAGATAELDWTSGRNKLEMSFVADVSSRVVKAADYQKFRDLCAALSAESSRTLLFKETD